jgi:hypothetical protein
MTEQTCGDDDRPRHGRPSRQRLACGRGSVGHNAGGARMKESIAFMPTRFCNHLGSTAIDGVLGPPQS